MKFKNFIYIFILFIASFNKFSFSSELETIFSKNGYITYISDYNQMLKSLDSYIKAGNAKYARYTLNVITSLVNKIRVAALNQITLSTPLRAYLASQGFYPKDDNAIYLSPNDKANAITYLKEALNNNIMNRLQIIDLDIKKLEESTPVSGASLFAPILLDNISRYTKGFNDIGEYIKANDAKNARVALTVITKLLQSIEQGVKKQIQITALTHLKSLRTYLASQNLYPNNAINLKVDDQDQTVKNFDIGLQNIRSRLAKFDIDIKKLETPVVPVPVGLQAAYLNRLKVLESDKNLYANAKSDIDLLKDFVLKKFNTITPIQQNALDNYIETLEDIDSKGSQMAIITALGKVGKAISSYRSILATKTDDSTPTPADEFNKEIKALSDRLNKLKPDVNVQEVKNYLSDLNTRANLIKTKAILIPLRLAIEALEKEPIQIWTFKNQLNNYLLSQGVKYKTEKENLKRINELATKYQTYKSILLNKIKKNYNLDTIIQIITKKNPGDITQKEFEIIERINKLLATAPLDKSGEDELAGYQKDFEGKA